MPATDNAKEYAPMKYLWKGKLYSLGTLARMHGKTLQCVNYRLDTKGMSLEQALTEPTRRAPPRKVIQIRAFERLDGEVGRPGEIPKRFAWDGKEMTIPELVKVAGNGISTEALRGRLVIGWRLADAMAIPVKPARRRA